MAGALVLVPGLAVVAGLAVAAALDQLDQLQRQRVDSDALRRLDAGL